MQELVNIYKNDFGLGFYWKKDTLILNDRIQIVFRDMGQSCNTQQCCRSILLKTPATTIDLAINSKELALIEDLLNGILFHLSLQDYLQQLSLN